MANHPDLITDALMRAVSFMEGFEGDELQEGIDGPTGDLEVIRRALAERENRSLDDNELRALGLAVDVDDVDITETACCVWEAILDVKGDELIAAAFERHGTAAIRQLACWWASLVEADWRSIGGGEGYMDSFDWEFVPEWLALNINWSSVAPSVNSIRRIPGQSEGGSS